MFPQKAKLRWLISRSSTPNKGFYRWLTVQPIMQTNSCRHFFFQLPIFFFTLLFNELFFSVILPRLSKHKREAVNDFFSKFFSLQVYLVNLSYSLQRHTKLPIHRLKTHIILFRHTGQDCRRGREGVLLGQDRWQEMSLQTFGKYTVKRRADLNAQGCSWEKHYTWITLKTTSL